YKQRKAILLDLTKKVRKNSGARMEFPVNFPQPASRDMCVNFRRADVRVAKQFLNHAQIRAMLQQMRRKTVPQHVRRDVPRNSRALNAFFHSQPKRDRCKWRSFL